MVLRLQLENGKIKEYPTHWTIHATESGDQPWHYTKCGQKFEGNVPKTGDCDNLDCALDVPISEIKYYFKMGMIISLLMFFASLWQKRDLISAVPDTMGISFFFGVFLIIISIFNYRKWSELNEYKKHGTIHGLKAYKM